MLYLFLLDWFYYECWKYVGIWLVYVEFHLCKVLLEYLRLWHVVVQGGRTNNCVNCNCDNWRAKTLTEATKIISNCPESISI